MIQQRVFVTGAGGFVGRNVCAGLLKAGFGVLGITRKCGSLPIGVENVVVGCIDDCTNFLDDLAGCNVVVHLAARVHVTKETSFDPLTEFRQMNVRSTLNLARQAAMAGIRRFVFISSIGVNGAATFQKPFAEHDPVAPHSPYAVSKHEAELGLQALAAETGMEVVIIRPPLVYGPNAPGNFGALIRAVQRGWPLPLGAIHNKRSLIGLDNLVNFIVTCVNHPSAANQTFLISDGQDVSTTELVCGIAQAMGRPARLLPVPTRWLILASAMMGKPDAAQRLCGSLQVDTSKAHQLLGWTPPLSLNEGLKKVAEGLRV